MRWRTIARLPRPRKSDNSARKAGLEVGKRDEEDGERKEEKKRGKGNEARECVCVCV